MIVYRLAKSKWCDDLSGKGAELAGGRWNSKGTSMLYTSSSRALCVAEISVHLPLGILPIDYNMISISVPEEIAIMEIHPSSLPKNWNCYPYDDSTQKLGDLFIKEGKFLVLKVPSAVVQGDFNFLINPRHSQIALIKIESKELFHFDDRLFRKL